MISIAAERGAGSRIRRFTARNHGASHVCAAVSLFMINTVNSIEKFTGDAIVCEYKEDGGYIKFGFTEPPGHDAGLLTEAMMLGLYSVRDKYPDEIEITERDIL
jgi:hypothetical protein